MKPLLDWQDKEVVNIIDEISLWAAPFGRLLLEHIPMKPKATVLDIGFGLGFPLIELAQRFGADTKIYGIDMWEAAIERTREKIAVFGLEHVEIFSQSANNIPLADHSVDLICSNLGVNNFEDKETVLRECHRVLASDGRLCITTNTVGTFQELFDLFEEGYEALGLDSELGKFREYIAHRGTTEQIQEDFHRLGFELVQMKTDSFSLRFVDAAAVWNHGLIRVGFRSTWEEMVPENKRDSFFDWVEGRITKQIESEGVFRTNVPVLYLEFQKA